MKSNNSRYQDVDLLRGITICLMVMGHIGFGNIFDIWIHAFHMPVFFLISGYFFNAQRKVQDEIKKDAKSLLLPYFAVGLGTYCLWALVEGMKDPSRLLPMLINVIWINTGVFPIAGALWFLTVLFVSKVLFSLILSKTKGYKWASVICVFCGIIGAVYPMVTEIRLPWGIDIAFTAVFFEWIGYSFRNSKIGFADRLTALPGPVLIVLQLVFIFVAAFNGYVNMKFLEYGYFPLFWIGAILQTLIAWNVCKQFAEKSKGLRWLDRVVSIIAEIGKESIIYLCFNQLIIKALIGAAGRLPSLSRYQYPMSFLLLAVTMICLWTLSLLIKKTKIRTLFGI